MIPGLGCSCFVIANESKIECAGGPDVGEQIVTFGFQHSKLPVVGQPDLSMHEEQRRSPNLAG